LTFTGLEIRSKDTWYKKGTAQVYKPITSSYLLSSTSKIKQDTIQYINNMNRMIRHHFCYDFLPIFSETAYLGCKFSILVSK
jgi:hypothetical protein